METRRCRASPSRDRRRSRSIPGWGLSPHKTLCRSRGSSSSSFQGHHILKGRSIQRQFCDSGNFDSGTSQDTGSAIGQKAVELGNPDLENWLDRTPFDSLYVDRIEIS